jgi:hypothetical protein
MGSELRPSWRKGEEEKEHTPTLPTQVHEQKLMKECYASPLNLNADVALSVIGVTFRAFKHKVTCSRVLNLCCMV